MSELEAKAIEIIKTLDKETVSDLIYILAYNICNNVVRGGECSLGCTKCMLSSLMQKYEPKGPN
ncbi:MAG: hypothetical protein ACFFDT_00305 [Candidatus Hodarchaeota archaeon]